MTTESVEPDRPSGRRTSYFLDGVAHKAPIPGAARVGNLVMSSAITGKDPASGETPQDTRRQVQLAFMHMEQLVRVAGGSPDDIVRVTVWLRERDDKSLVDEEWVAMFPDPADRPARHAVGLDRPGTANVQLEFIAVVEGPTQ